MGLATTPDVPFVQAAAFAPAEIQFSENPARNAVLNDVAVERPAQLVFADRGENIANFAAVHLNPVNRGTMILRNKDARIKYRLSAIDLDVDTNRDGEVSIVEDEVGENSWDEQRGAIYNVNFDRDGRRQSDGLPIPDAIHFDRSGRPVLEDFKIENRQDELDIAPLVIRKIADVIPSGYRVFLRAAEPEDVRRIHVFTSISSDPENLAIWGRATGESPPLEIDITRWVNPASPSFQGDVVTGDTTFGIEGLFFRNVGPDVPDQLQFDGFIDLTLELRKGRSVVSADSVRLKVAPWIMLSRDQASEEIWSAAMGLRGLIQHGPGDRFVDGDTFTISDGHGERTFEFDMGPTVGVGQHNIAVILSAAFTSSEVSQAIAIAINEVDDFTIKASTRPDDPLSGSTSEAVGFVDLFNVDLTISADQVRPTAISVADPRFRIAGLGGPTNQSFLRSGSTGSNDAGLDISGQLKEVTGPENQNQWFQDHVEIGFTQRPGGPKTHVVFRLPYWRGTSGSNPIWPLTKLLGRDVGVFQLGLSLGGGSGDFGGNLEVLPPNRTHPVGRIVMGNRASERMQQFLMSQEVQDPVFDVPVKWLQLAHIDEVTSFLAGGRVAIADPTMAWNLLSEIPAAARDRSVFFAKGETPVSGVVTKDSYLAHRLQTGIDHRGQPWKYIRIYEGAAAGTVAEIDTLGNGYITIKRLWRTGSKIVYGTGSDPDINYARRHKLPIEPDWRRTAPKMGDKYVLVEETLFSSTGTPAIVTVSEILADRDFADLNKISVQGAMDQIQRSLASRTPSGSLTFIKVPALFFDNRRYSTREDFLTSRSAESFNPGPANLQVVAGKLFIGRQFGPRDELGRDIFEQAIRDALQPVPLPVFPRPVVLAAAPKLAVWDPENRNELGERDAKRIERRGYAIPRQREPPRAAVVDVVFVDDWDFYHRLIGNVHCGTVVKREILDFDWWNV